MTQAQTEPITFTRYNAQAANAIEEKWQRRWEDRGTFRSPNPGEEGFDKLSGRAKNFILDMFPYPSGAGLHVGHPLGYIATDIYARYRRAKGDHVMHAMGFDAFGLPAEQYAVEHGVHPRVTTERNINIMQAQLRRLGLAHDPTRTFATTDVAYYKWTQWIFLQIYNAWFDPDNPNAAGSVGKARPISELIAQFATGQRSLVHEVFNPTGQPWNELEELTQRRIIDDHRLAYLAEVPVNWCPALGTVLANEEVTADGRSDRGNHPVFKRPLKQWMLRITAYTRRLLGDLKHVDWPESIKLMQRNWIGRSEGALVDFRLVESSERVICVFTTRPDTLFGATYMVLAPEHPVVGSTTTDECRQAVEKYKRQAESRSDVDRMADTREKTGAFTGAYAINPANQERIPIWIADYVLMGYGTGAIMAVPAQDQRDWDFATIHNLPIRRTVRPPDDFDGEAYIGAGPAINSGFLNGMNVVEAKRRMMEYLEEGGLGRTHVQYKLRDWLFSRQRYWGEPYPIVYDEHDMPVALDEAHLPVELPDLDDFTPAAGDDPDAPPQPPLGRVGAWSHVEIDGRRYRRELNTMPQWAGSCWYYLRYADAHNHQKFVDPNIERYWMLSRKNGESCAATETFNPETHHWGGVDLYVGGVEHAVLHLLYARFWHKILFDLGYVSTPEPFGKLFNQGYIQAYAYTDSRGVYIPSEDVQERDGRYFHADEEVTRSYGKMGKSLKNAVTPDDIFRDYGCDTLRLYEMSMGPLEQSKPWNTRDIIGAQRFLQRIWRNFIDPDTGALRVADNGEPDEDLRKLMHRTIDRVDRDMRSLSFNTAITALIEFNNALVSMPMLPREIAEVLVKLLAPFAPHLAEELWERLGHVDRCVTFELFPEADESYLIDEEIELVVQVQGKVRGKVVIPADADEETARSAALGHKKVAQYVAGKTIRKVIYVPGRLINFVVG